MAFSGNRRLTGKHRHYLNDHNRAITAFQLNGFLMGVTGIIEGIFPLLRESRCAKHKTTFPSQKGLLNSEPEKGRQRTSVRTSFGGGWLGFRLALFEGTWFPMRPQFLRRAGLSLRIYFIS